MIKQWKNKRNLIFRELRTVQMCLFVIFFVSVNTYANTFQQKNYSFTAKNMPIKTAFKALEKATSYSIFFYDGIISNDIKVNVSAEKQSIQTIMNQILAGTNLTYRISNNQITIVRKSQDSSQSKPELIKYSGTVLDDKGEPIIGANIQLVGTNKGTITNIDGKFTIEAAENSNLQISYVGYFPQKVSLQGSGNLTVKLIEDTKAIEEVVVIGYGTVKKSDLTGAVSSVKTDDIKDVPATRVDQMLQGRIAGAEIVSTSGEPGADTSIRIRGTRSITATNEPLYVVDGVIDGVSSLNELNPSDIESIEVLKDASSTAIYGSRGSNGVILITTKIGTGGKARFTFKAEGGVSQLPRYLDLMNAAEFAMLQNDRSFFNLSNSSTGIYTEVPIERLPFANPLALGEGTNWTKEVTRVAPYQNYTFSGNGGTKTLRYFFSANYNNNQGIIKNSGMERYQVRLNLDNQFNKIVKGGVRLNYSYVDQDNNLCDVGTNSLWYRSAIFLAPTISAYKEDGSFNDWNPQWYTGQKFDSPLANVMLRKDNTIKKSLSSNAYLEVKPLSWLTLKTSLSFYNYDRYDDRFIPSTMPTRVAKTQGAYAYKSVFRDNNLLNENTISFKKSWKKAHNLDAIYGFTCQKRWNANLGANGDGYLVDRVDVNDLTAVPSKETVSLSSSANEQLQFSNLARVNYNYKQKYYLTITGRADAASNFAPNNKWAFFPSGAFKWNMKKEDFMKEIDLIGELSIRLSAGASGNQGISNYMSRERLSTTSNGYIFGGAIPVAYYPSRIANDNLTWEKTTSYNAGVDVSFLGKRINLTVDYYQSYTTDLLLSVQLPSQTGYTSRLENIGKTSNKGVEIAINSNNITTRKFNWSTTLTLAHNNQMVDDIGGLDRVSAYDNPYGALYCMYGYQKGYPLNALWGMQYAGVWKSVEEIAANKALPTGERKYVSSNGNFEQPGRQRYKDQNGDGLLDNNDLVYLGNADPKVYGGLQNTFKYGNFDLSIFFNFSIGGKIYNVTETFMGTGTYLSNQYKYMVNAWHPYRNPTSDLPRADSKDDIPCDRFVHDASFLRLKNVGLGYTLPMKKYTKLVNQLRFSVNANNLYLWKHYNGYDPEVSTQSANSAIRRMDNGAYPASRTVTFSVQLDF